MQRDTSTFIFGSGLGFGLIFFIHSCYYKFDTLTEYDWPVRDPCEKGELDQLNGIAEPRGNILIHLLMNINCSPMCNFSCQWWTRSLNKLTKDFAFSQSQIFFNEVENPWAWKRQLLKYLQWPIYASYQLSWWSQITLLYSLSDAAPQTYPLHSFF